MVRKGRAVCEYEVVDGMRRLPWGAYITRK